MNIQQAVTLIHRIAERGPTPAMYANVTKAFHTIWKHQMPDAELKERLVVPSTQVYDEDLPGDIRFFNFINTVFSQKYGYAGDWELLSNFYEAYDKYYTDWALDRSPGLNKKFATKWDQYFLSLPCGQSVMNRETYLIDEITKLITQKKVMTVLDVACGNGRLMKKLAKRYPHVVFVGIDNEPTAIKAAVETDYPDNCSFIEMNAIQKFPDTHFDVVVSAGLCDYLDDKHFTRLVRRIEYHVQPKYVILGNLTHHDSIPQMALLRWNLIYRTGADLVSLASNYFQDKKFRVGKEDCGVNLFLHIESKE